MRISDWSSDVCSSDLPAVGPNGTFSIIDASGNRLVAAPKMTGNLGIEYRTQIGANAVTASANMVYNDGFYWHGDNRLRPPSYTLLNGSVTMDLVDGKYQVRVWGQTLDRQSTRLNTSH